MNSYNEHAQTSPLHEKPDFLITIDTEGDNLWAKPQKIKTRNAEFLPRFQTLCESYGFKPTYLTNYEMAMSPVFVEFGQDVLVREVGEIGMHLHAWNSPPLTPLTGNDHFFTPYLIEYPEPVIRKKVTVLTNILEDTFNVKMLSHRAGRWSFNETYAKILVESGYCVDSSVTPYVSWVEALGDPDQKGGTDYSQFPEDAYFLDLQDIRSPGQSSLLEIPVTVATKSNTTVHYLNEIGKHFSFFQKAMKWFFPPIWLRPNGNNQNDLLFLVKQALDKNKKYLQFMLHSSELMPGGSPAFSREEDIERLYEDLEVLFSTAHKNFAGTTLAAFAQQF